MDTKKNNKKVLFLVSADGFLKSADDEILISSTVSSIPSIKYQLPYKILIIYYHHLYSVRKAAG